MFYYKLHDDEISRYTDDNGNFWNLVGGESKKLAKLGINAVWFPPAYKAIEGGNSKGYDTYDLFDLGEFDLKGSIRGPYGKTCCQSNH